MEKTAESMVETRKTEMPNPGDPVGSPGPAAEEAAEAYPLRNPGEDPRWAVRTVVIWVGFALVSLAFILVLLILGALVD